jgi:hypothetical protein
MINFWVLSRRLSSLDASLAKRALVSALKSAEAGIQEGETLDQEIAFNLVHACTRYDWFFGPGSSERLLNMAQEAYPDQHILTVARVRAALNQGKIEEARSVARSLNEENPEQIFAQAEEIMQNLIATDEEDMWEMVKPSDEAEQ